MLYLCVLESVNNMMRGGNFFGLPAENNQTPLKIPQYNCQRHLLCGILRETKSNG